MAVTMTVAGPPSEVRNFLIAMETILLDGERYTYMRQTVGETEVYLVVKED